MMAGTSVDIFIEKYGKIDETYSETEWRLRFAFFIDGWHERDKLLSNQSGHEPDTKEGEQQ